MPFVKQADRQAGRPPVEVGSIFTGRVNEQRFFVKHVLTPEVPTSHVIWVWGPAGVGKSTLLTHLRDEDALAALEQVLTAELPLPAVLLAPLRWLEQKRPDFYRHYVEPVLARAEGRAEQCA